MSSVSEICFVCVCGVPQKYVVCVCVCVCVCGVSQKYVVCVECHRNMLCVCVCGVPQKYIVCVCVCVCGVSQKYAMCVESQKYVVRASSVSEICCECVECLTTERHGV